MKQSKSADLAREPGRLNTRCGYGLLTRQVDWCLPAFHGKVAVDLEFLADALHHLEREIIQCGLVGSQILVAGRRPIGGAPA
jgi:hypothetical protein